MNLYDYIVLGGVIIAVICAVIWIVRRKRQGKSGCSCCPQKDRCEKKCIDFPDKDVL